MFCHYKSFCGGKDNPHRKIGLAYWIPLGEVLVFWKSIKIRKNGRIAMDKLFISRLEIKQVRHLRDITIPLSEQRAKHLILTGKNGSGKTSVTEALARYLNKIYIGEREQAFRNCQKELDIKLNNNIDKIPELAEKYHYILAYYEADRFFCAEQPKHVEKVELKNYYALTEFPRTDFVKYL